MPASVEAFSKAADSAKPAALARTIDAYADDFPHEVGWATRAQARALLQQLFIAIDLACRDESKPARRRFGLN
jgi:hypothetical protein